MDRSDFLYGKYLTALGHDPTSDQSAFLREVASFLTTDDGDVLVLDGYAGTGKTTAVAAVVSVMAEMRMKTVLLAPTGRAAKVLASYTGRPAYTIHKHIYRQSSVDDNGLGRFSISPNKSRNSLFVVDEVSLIGIEQGGGSAMFGSGNVLQDLVTFVRSAPGCKLLMVGDSAQLPPVGMEKSPALSEEYMSFAGGVRFVAMREVVRQQRKSGILVAATRLRELITQDIDFIPAAEVHLPLVGDDLLRLRGAELIETLTGAYGSYGENETMVLSRSNKMANRYNAGIRAQIQYKEDRLVRGDKLMIVKNNYKFCEKSERLDYIANGDIAILEGIHGYEDRYGLHFAEAELSFPDYDDEELTVKVCLDTLVSESASLTSEEQNALYQGVMQDYADIRSKKKRYDAVREDPYYNALQLKYANAITCHKAQGGQWRCIFIDNPFWQEELTLDDMKWLYTALTRGVEKVYLINFRDNIFQ